MTCVFVWVSIPLQRTLDARTTVAAQHSPLPVARPHDGPRRRPRWCRTNPRWWKGEQKRTARKIMGIIIAV